MTSGESRLIRTDEPVDPPGPGESWTVLRLIRWSGRYLREKGVDEGRLDAEHLLADSLGLSRLELYLQFDRPLTGEELATFKPLLLRRAEREPLQHVLGHATFRELELIVDARALVPRPETEVLVEAVLRWARDEEGRDLDVLDVGTGGGAIALSLAREGPFSRVVASDPSADALALAAENRAAAGLDDRVELRRGSVFEPVADGERFDVVVSNPPYVAEKESAGLAPEVREWEPWQALYGGADGLDVLRALVREAPPVLRRGGLLALEMGAGHGEALMALVEEVEDLRDPVVRKDLAGRDRILLATRR